MNFLTHVTMRHGWFHLPVVLALALLPWSSPGRADGAATQRNLNAGYYLLHKLADDESQLPLLLDLKHAPDEIVQFADEISRLSKRTEATVEQFRDGDPALNYDVNPLPPFERDVRESIAGDKQHQLLFGSTGDEFVRVLIVSQIEATTYALHICGTLAEQETSPARAEKLRRLTNEWREVRNKAQRILRNY